MISIFSEVKDALSTYMQIFVGFLMTYMITKVELTLKFCVLAGSTGSTGLFILEACPYWYSGIAIVKCKRLVNNVLEGVFNLYSE